MNVDTLQNSVMVNVRCGWWGAMARYDENKLGKDVPKKIVRAVQDLLEDKSLIDEARTIQRKLKGFIGNNSLPCPIDGVYLVAKDRVPVIHDKVNESIELMSIPVNKLVSNYGRLKRKFKKKYPDQYQSEKYPTSKRLKARFYIDCNFFQIGMPDNDIMELDPEQYRQAVQRFQNMAEEIEEMAVTLIGNRLMQRLDKLQKQCETGEGIHGRTIGSINRFLDNWKEMWSGQVDDKKLTMIMARLRGQMKKVSADRLRGNEEFRGEVAAKIEKIMTNLDRIPNVSLKRKIDI